MLQLVIMGLAAAALGAFVGLDRQLAGARHALPAHAVAGCAGALGAAGARFVHALLVWSGEQTETVAGLDDVVVDLLLSPWGLLALVVLVMALGALFGLGRWASRSILGSLAGDLVPAGDVFSLSCAVGLGVLAGTATWREVVVGVLAVVVLGMLRPRPPLPLVSPTGDVTLLHHSDPWRDSAGATANLPAQAANYVVYPLLLNASSPEGWRMAPPPKPVPRPVPSPVSQPAAWAGGTALSAAEEPVAHQGLGVPAGHVREARAQRGYVVRHHRGSLYRAPAQKPSVVWRTV